MVLFKVMNIETEMFNKGGVYTRWSKQGKVWTSLGSLRSFITLTMKGAQDINKWRIIEYQVNVASVKELSEVIKPEKMIELLSK